MTATESMIPTISYYGGPNTVTVTLGKVTLYFSYATCVAFRHQDAPGPLVCENDNQGRPWSKTTSKHINQIPGGRTAPRIPHPEFLQTLGAVCDEIH